MSHSLLEVNSLEYIFNLFKQDEKTIVQHLQDCGLLRKKLHCNRCRLSMTLEHDTRIKGSYALKCKKCLKSIPLTKGTCFEDVDIPFRLFFILLWLWCCQVRSLLVHRLVGTSRKTILKCYRLFNYICAWKLLLLDDKFIVGGPGVVVQVDVCVLTNRKQTHSGEKLLLGIVDTRERRGIFVIVPDREAETLCEAIEEHVLPGSVIWTDCSKSYKNLNFWKGVSPFKHCTVDKSKNFVDPKTGACTNAVLAHWARLKKFFREIGVPSWKVLPEHIDRFKWHHFYGPDEIASFQAFLKHLSERYAVH
uniref:ISXO2-like transposase domain-containing protein n=1 Tax=Timema bartmani TaxID=61472 RepID=A0A7R9I2W9_9NEOP|nr:unnamed protein product [Timema bartmani]